jgi:hypothetical protein
MPSHYLSLTTFCTKGQKKAIEGCSDLPLGHPDQFECYSSKLKEVGYRSNSMNQQNEGLLTLTTNVKLG